MMEKKNQRYVFTRFWQWLLKDKFSEKQFMSKYPVSIFTSAFSSHSPHHAPQPPESNKQKHTKYVAG